MVSNIKKIPFSGEVKAECFSGAYNKNATFTTQNSYSKATLYIIASLGGQTYSVQEEMLTLEPLNVQTIVGDWYKSNEIYDIPQGATITQNNTPSGWGSGALILVGN